MYSVSNMAQDSISAGRVLEKLNLPNLQSKMKADPEGYGSELNLIYNQFKSSLELFERQAAMNFTSLSGIGNDPTVAKDLGDRSMFLANVILFYPKQLSYFPNELAQFLKSSARSLPSGLRMNVTHALIMLINRKMIDISETLILFMELQTMGDRALKKLAFSHVIQSIRRINHKHKNDPKNRALQNILYGMMQSIRRINHKHKNDPKNRALQNILYGMMQQEEEKKAKVALVTLFDLHQRKVWVDDRTANAICMACFHASPRIMTAALSFLLDFEKIEDGDDSDDSGSEDEATTQQPQIMLNKETVYKASHKGTASSKKKKKAKLLRVARSMKKKQRLSSENNSSNYYSPLNHLKDAQGFAEKLLSRLQNCNERFELKMVMLKVIARTIGLHRLILLNFYPYLQKYVQPHQREITSLLAAAVQSCHDMVPPDAVEPLFKQVVNQFVHDKSRTEAIAVGLNVVREICLRMPLLMTEDLLQDLVLYRKSHEKAVSSAARSLLSLFREVCPSLLTKKDRGRPTNPKAVPKAFGEVNIASDIPDIELLEQDDDSDENMDEEAGACSIGDDNSDENVDEDADACSLGEDYENASDGRLIDNDDSGECECGSGGGSENESAHSSDYNSENDDRNTDNDDLNSEMSNEDDNNMTGDADDEEYEDAERVPEPSSPFLETDTSGRGDGVHDNGLKAQKRKLSDFEEQLNAADKSLRALKKLAGVISRNAPSDTNDGILSNEDFQRIKELKAKKEARTALAQHGFKLPTSEQLSVKRVDAAKLEANIKQKLTKQERLALIRAGREERGKYQARTAIKQKKTGGLSNRQKEHKKAMPLAAKRAKVAKSRLEKKKLKQRAGKQFRGRKAWK
ncbi:hypothetical protein F511_42274 [Dorcoceras hygrometricum]|uniref:Protein SDA1 n=1 Tax=Dorcoceras hygrometricum TaxID=472368 RepID=A0A2Z6ZZB4_9LAMI|nr:hypothetical protein F511_42274 [Dorcoceras hygrometricum]